MADEKRYTYRLKDETIRVSGGFPLAEEGGPATEEKIDELLKKHYPGGAYFQKEEDGRILIYRSEAEADDETNAVGEVFPVE